MGGGVPNADLNVNDSCAAGDGGVAICYETAPFYKMENSSEFASAMDASRPATTSESVVAAPPTLSSDDSAITNQKKFQAEISKWEEYYDQLHHHLSNKTNTSKDKHFPKSATNFSISQDGKLFYAKLMKDGTVLYLKVIRDYDERVRICREIHLDTNDITLHHRRDKMLELLGQAYFWKGQRRDVCQCVRNPILL